MNEKLEEIINKGSEISGNISGVALGLLIAGPIGAIGGAALVPLLTSVFKKVGVEISEIFLGKREEIRVGATIALSVNKLDNEIKAGKKLRTDNFYNTTNLNRSNAETLLEGTLLKAKNEYEEKKIIFYSNFITNVNLDESISFEKADRILRIIERISFRQIVILSYISKTKSLNVEKWMISFSRIKELALYQDLYSEIIDLYNSQLLQQSGSGITTSISKLQLSPLGITVCNLLELGDITTEEFTIIKKTIDSINNLKEK